MRNVAGIAVVVLVIVQFMSVSAHTGPPIKHPIQCGDTLGPGGIFRLTHDLECDAAVHAVALTLLSHTRLDMRNHKIICSATPPALMRLVGVQLEGQGASVNDGEIDSCHIGVSVVGTGKHFVKGMHVRGGDNSYDVRSDRNLLVDNSVVGGDFAFAIFGDDNLLFDNLSTEAAGNGFVLLGRNNHAYWNMADGMVCHGFSVNGPGNRLHHNEARANALPNCPAIIVSGGDVFLHDNIARGNAGDGLLILIGGANFALGNRADDNRGAGVHVQSASSDNVLVRNIARGNETFDLQDDNVGCANNRWLANKSQTHNQACVQ
jgi:parallel beta-helix repeat protein